MKIIYTVLTILLVIFMNNLKAQNLDSNPHQMFTNLLQKYVSTEGKVDYKGMSQDVDLLDKYLVALAKEVPTGNADKELAYWINVYNAFTIKLILEESKNKNLHSIMELDEGKVWDRKWIKIEDQVYSLNNIENDIIRVKFYEPRIHFAVNCAAKSCPPLRKEAYTEKELDSQLEEQTNKFINDSQQNLLGRKEIVISKIFEWYAADFGDLRNFINRYSSVDVSEAIIGYQEYDWSLNN